MNKAVFLDRDGTINEEVHYLHDIHDLHFIEGVPQALAQLKRLGYKLVVISNQSGIGRGYFDTGAVDRLHEYMNMLLEQQGAAIDAFYYCPHIARDCCRCRKPLPGMIEQAAADLDIDLSQSYMVGDKETDVLTAINAGCRYALLLSGHTVSEDVKMRYQGNVYADLGDFVRHIGE